MTNRLTVALYSISLYLIFCGMDWLFGHAIKHETNLLLAVVFGVGHAVFTIQDRLDSLEKSKQV